MGDLRDQLKKANLLSKKDARRLAHEERVRRTAVGGAAGVDKERAEHDAELRRQQDERRANDRAAQLDVQAQRDAAAERAACQDLLRNESRRPGGPGASRWYFELEDGRLPFLDLRLADRLQLTEGNLSIVRVGPPDSHDYALLATRHAERVARVFPDLVVKGGTPAGGAGQ